MLFVQKWGNGPEPLLAFHGIGQDHRVFADWQELSRFTVYAIDLPFHGASTVPPGKVIEKKEWIAWLTAFLAGEGIDRFSLAGFSMGGRLALVALEALAGRVNGVYLIAPDGIRENPFYRLAVGTAPGRAVFRFLVFRPELLLAFGGWAEKWGWVHASVTRFVRWMLDSREKQTRVYLAWTAFRKLTFSGTLPGVPILFVMGQYDRLMPPASVEHLLSETATRVVLRCGHNQLVEKTAEYLGSKKPGQTPGL
ncbi:alpha/beta fold hydrolase [Siphonobacter aquaeclarae]|uniref:Pimeloyl-ACP methyl ester carboxylesterase' /ribosomal slippage n=1 Tax=Siphonobacter aquaeclarae TaxID=563176 RepID=A0A1G9MXP6_9BACT|nr:alpha/beta hydrolase [Siphonobacter aquaeclarae]SDL79042.1 Pimeloyl-ACP methyl ester carboxylesterase' /ribosomal slippage [Siphonobacter aquaeclarae]